MTFQFPALDADAVLSAVERHWDFTHPVPLPRGDWLRCPTCRAEKPQPRYWQWHVRPANATIPHRCDVAFKCVACSMIWSHGVAVPAEYFHRHGRHKKKVHWRAVAKMIEKREGR